MFGVGRKSNPHELAVGMTGVKMGDRLMQIGCPDGGRLAALAGKVGLSGRAVAIVADEGAADRARKGAARAGVLLEVDVSQPTRLPVEDAAFDLAVVDDTAGDFGSRAPEDQVGAVRELLRVLRPGGRVVVIGQTPREGLGAFFSRGTSGVLFNPLPLLQTDGFRSARHLAAREGLVFVEGMKART